MKKFDRIGWMQILLRVFFRKENVVRARNEGGRKKPEAVQLFSLLYYSRN